FSSRAPGTARTGQERCSCRANRHGLYRFDDGKRSRAAVSNAEWHGLTPLYCFIPTPNWFPARTTLPPPTTISSIFSLRNCVQFFASTQIADFEPQQAIYVDEAERVASVHRKGTDGISEGPHSLGDRVGARIRHREKR